MDVRLLKDRGTCSYFAVVDALQTVKPELATAPTDIHTPSTTGNRDLTHREPPPAETPENIARLKSALSVLSADCEYDEWRDVVWSIKAHGWPCGEEIAREWSQTAPDRYTSAGFDVVWERSL